MAAAAVLVAVSILIYQLQRPAKPDAPQLAGADAQKPASGPELNWPDGLICWYAIHSGY